MKKILSWVFIVISFVFALSVNTSYIETGGQFINIEKWKELTFWVQIIVNTFVLTQVYAMVLRNKKDEIIINNTHIGELYEKLWASKNRVIKNNRKEELNIYLSVLTNLTEKLELYIYKIEKSLKRAIRHKRKVKLSEKHEEYEKYLSAVKLLDFPVIEKMKTDVHGISVKHQKINFDTIYDMVDYKSSKPISIGYSEAKETNKKIAQSPLSSFVTMFTAIVAFGNIMVWSEDWRSMVLITLTLVVTALIKISNALEDAKEIAANKSRALEKSVDTVEMFENIKPDQLNLMKSILLNAKSTNEKETEKETDDEKDFIKGDTYTTSFLPVIAK